MKTKNLSKIMKTAWQFFKTTGQNFAKCLTLAWANYKLVLKMQLCIVKFYYQKVDGSIREAYGTLTANHLPATTDNRAKNATVQIYFDTEAGDWRCFKKLNLISY